MEAFRPPEGTLLVNILCSKSCRTETRQLTNLAQGISMLIDHTGLIWMMHMYGKKKVLFCEGQWGEESSGWEYLSDIWCHSVQCQTKLRFLSLGTIDILDLIILCGGLPWALQDVQPHACLLPTSCQFASPSPSCDNQKNLPIFPDILEGWGGS